MTPRVLIVEDDAALRHSLRAILEGAGYQVTAVGDGAAGARALRQGGFDAVLLDIGLPFVDGWQILSGLEAGQAPSVIVISARGEERDKVRALDAGADDYLAKPFGAEELLARIRAVLRRSAPPGLAGPAIRLDGVVIDLARHSVTREGTEVRLSPTEYGLLSRLAREPGVLVDHRTLLRDVWGASRIRERNYLWTFIQRLRLKLEEDPHRPRIIVSVGSRGYRLGGPPPPPGSA